MAKREYTASQKQAVYDHGSNILVSASAGSGKTSVLVERVIQKILAGENVDQLLVVTFTEAAAKEMKERIRVAITQQINQSDNHEQKKHLMDQLTRLGKAQISTIHAFCLSIIRSYYYVIELDPSFRIMTDTTESELLKEEVWNELREELYDIDNEVFAKLTQNFSGDRRDDNLRDLVLNLFEFANANPDSKLWLEQMGSNYELDGELMDSPFFKNKLIPDIKDQLQTIYKKALSLKDIADQGSELIAKSRDVIDEEVSEVQSVLDNGFGSDWNHLRTAMLSVDLTGRLSAARKDEVKEFNQIANEIRSDKVMGYRVLFNNLVNEYFKLPEDMLLNAVQDSKNLIDELIRVVTMFSDRFKNEKLERHSLDFSDLEHFALEIVTNESEAGLAVRHSFQKNFNEIIVDEYQDINPLQETLLSSVASTNPGNMFMVGDVKQSIYAFRMADPGLFLGKNDRFKDSDNPDERIILAENFRSMRNVDNFTNLIFNQIMDSKIGEIEYDDDAQLRYGAKYYPDEIKNKTEVLVYDEQKKQETDVPSMSQTDGQITMIAQKIRSMIRNQETIFDRKEQVKRPVQFGDIVLLSQTRSKNLKIVEIFKQFDIPIEVSDAQDYFQTTEISIMMDMLRIIDNPYQDIPLVAVLRSPMVGMNENELAFLRINQKTGDYFESLLHFEKSFKVDPENEFQANLKQKLDRFMQQLRKFRKLAQQSNLVNLVWAIYNDTGYLDYVGGMPDGPQRQNNLHALYNRAKAYEESSFKGVFQFVRFVEKMRDKKKDLAENPVKTSEESVLVMTIHGSKGLEFPFVFLIDANHGFNKQDQNRPYILDRNEGVGITLNDYVHHLSIDTPQKIEIKDTLQKRSLAEEMRVLYVALTRAEQRLIITGSTDDAEKALTGWSRALQSENDLLDDPVREKAGNYLDWIGSSIVRIPVIAEQYNLEPVHTIEFDGEVGLSFINTEELNQNIVVDSSTNDEAPVVFNSDKSLEVPTDAQWINEVLNFKYRDEVATKTTAYQSVSEVKRIFDDPDKLEMNFSEVTNEQQLKTVNRFVNKTLPSPKFLEKVRKPKPTEIGTATHLVLQEIDLHQAVNEDVVQHLINDLVNNQVLAEEVARSINIDNILRFFESDMGQLMLAHPDEVQREAPFSMLVPAQTIFHEVKSEDDILIHGIIDAYLKIDGRVILLDYKTDFVKPGTKEAGVAKIIDKYRGQINLYGLALENITQQTVTDKYLYLLSVGELVSVE